MLVLCFLKAHLMRIDKEYWDITVHDLVMFAFATKIAMLTVAIPDDSS